ncbi:hypothetical protein PUNSTDRAFT_130487 [Punctularia strigosozonata HHB-11173 SS5]|uniref:uncharacterized protein n=1 Tax=Punctularia strigosozonata (strain HHB-11173) TaxID=741275 RepID=UPI0004416930|nr:uncharacterized protein PUNSTDRAFT_130487 [Punctularia strigosozonata HHB-11173 SS5]EIN12217.1 hypothetical protein PUNSTDRAFT_130487 [Punctularia strigosozonata HHB-11173 SS5]
MAVVAFVMYGIAASHLAITFFQLLEAIARTPNADDPGLPVNAAQIYIEGANYLIGDSVVIWRVWGVWGCNWRMCVLPSLLLAGSIVAVFGGAHQQSITPTGVSAVDVEVGRWGTAFGVLTLATNLCCTILIGIRAWSLSRLTGAVNIHTTSSRILLLLVETGALYSATWIVTLVLFVTGSTAYEVVTSCLPQFTPMYPSLLLLVVHRVYRDPSSGSVGSSTLVPRSSRISFAARRRQSISVDVDEHEMQPVVMDITGVQSPKDLEDKP